MMVLGMLVLSLGYSAQEITNTRRIFVDNNQLGTNTPLAIDYSRFNAYIAGLIIQCMVWAMWLAVLGSGENTWVHGVAYGYHPRQKNDGQQQQQQRDSVEQGYPISAQQQESPMYQPQVQKQRTQQVPQVQQQQRYSPSQPAQTVSNARPQQQQQLGQAAGGGSGGNVNNNNNTASRTASPKPETARQVQSNNSNSSSGMRAQALYPYTANPEDPNEVSFKKGDQFEVIDNKGKWWQVRNAEGKIGIVPSNYLQVL